MMGEVEEVGEIKPGLLIELIGLKEAIEKVCDRVYEELKGLVKGDCGLYGEVTDWVAYGDEFYMRKYGENVALAIATYSQKRDQTVTIVVTLDGKVKIVPWRRE